MQFDIRHNLPPDKLYFDTSFLISALIETRDHKIRHKEARSFLKKIEDSDTFVLTSCLTEIEYIEQSVYAVLSIRVGKDVKAAVKANSDILKKYKSEIDDYIGRYKHTKDLFLNRWADLAIDNDVIKFSRKCAQNYNLLFKDAIHLASMNLMKCNNLVSFDKDFSRVGGISHYTLPKKILRFK